MHPLAFLYDLQLSLERPALRAAVELADPGPNERLLDIATGTAGLLRELAPRTTRPAVAIGVDSSPSMLAGAPVLPSGWRLHPADAERLPFTNGRFDVVTVAYLLHLLTRTQRGQVLREAARVLRPGGRLVTVTVDARRPVSRRLLQSMPRRSGLRALDPSKELAGAGLEPRCSRFVNGGWPSLCVLAREPR